MDLRTFKTHADVPWLVNELWKLIETELDKYMLIFFPAQHTTHMPLYDTLPHHLIYITTQFYPVF